MAGEMMGDVEMNMMSMQKEAMGDSQMMMKMQEMGKMMESKKNTMSSAEMQAVMAQMDKTMQMMSKMGSM